MKVSIAVIKLVLRTNKVLSDGSHPIMLRCSFNGMKERSTGYSCLPRFWDKKSECVKKGYPNYAMVNYELKKQKDEAIRRRDEFIASDEVYTPSMLMFNGGDYFLPTLNGFEGNLKKRVNNLYTYHGKHLVEWFQRVNEEIVRRNVEGEAHLELIDLECRYYSARHSYIMAQIQKPNVNLLKIATVTGKSVTTLHQYLTYLNDIDLAE